MKTFCVAVVVLSLVSASQSASLACQKLMKPADKDLDISGTWHYIAFSTEHCWLATLFNVFFWPSAAVHVTARSAANLYDGNVQVKMYGLCANESEPFHFANRNIFDVDGNNAPTGEADVLLQTGCPDCMVVKGVDLVNTLILFTTPKREPTVTSPVGFSAEKMKPKFCYFLVDILDRFGSSDVNNILRGGTEEQ